MPLVKVPVEAAGSMLVGTTTAVANVLSNGLLVLIFTCFLLFGTAAGRQSHASVLGEIESNIRRYIVTKVFISGATGTLVGLVLWMLGVELALVFGLLAFLLNFIPNVGSVIATLLPLPVVIVSPNVTPVAAVLAIAIPGSIQFVIGNVLEPRIMGESVDLHPITVLLALIFWGMLWGVVGMFLAVPMTAIMRILLARSELTAPVARVLTGRGDEADA
ncbi:MAG: AI-2E family transporter [Planctomycetota bacterium]